MPSTPKSDRNNATHKSGIHPRPNIEPDGKREPSRPPLLPELRNDVGATTGTVPVVREGQDTYAIGDEDSVNEQ